MRAGRAAFLVAALATLVTLAGQPAGFRAAAQAAGSGATAPAATGSGAANATRGGDVELSDRAFAIARKLRCPVCTAESVADSDAEISAEMRTLIQQQLDAGKSETQIVRYFKQRYGDWILLDPPKRGVHLLVWLLPALAFLAGAVALVLLVRRWRAAADATPQADPDAVARVRSALARRTGAVEGDATYDDVPDGPGGRA